MKMIRFKTTQLIASFLSISLFLSAPLMADPPADIPVPAAADEADLLQQELATSGMSLDMSATTTSFTVSMKNIPADVSVSLDITPPSEKTPGGKFLMQVTGAGQTTPATDVTSQMTSLTQAQDPGTAATALQDVTTQAQKVVVATPGMLNKIGRFAWLNLPSLVGGGMFFGGLFMEGRPYLGKPDLMAHLQTAAWASRWMGLLFVAGSVWERHLLDEKGPNGISPYRGVLNLNPIFWLTKLPHLKGGLISMFKKTMARLHRTSSSGASSCQDYISGASK